MISNKKVILLGDSFADKTSRVRLIDFISWPNMLENYYKVLNFAKNGSGPDYQLTQFLDLLEKHNYRQFTDTVVIFLISDINRYAFNFYTDPKDHHLSIHLTQYKNIDPSYLDEAKPYLKYGEFVYNFYKHYALNDMYQNTELLKITGVMKLYANLFERILIWPIFAKIPQLVTSDSTFTIVDTPLFTIEGNALGNNDLRANPLIKENHKVMLFQLIEWIETGKNINIDSFVRTKN